MAAIVLLIIVVVRMPRSDLGDWAEALGNIGTLIVSLLGSSAAVWWWKHRGSASPRLKVTQSVSILPSTGGYIPIYITAHLENVGEVPVMLTKWCLWATDMLPLPPAIDSLLATNPDRACRDFRLPWKLASGAEFDIPEQDAPHVRPGETQDIGALLRVPSEAQFVRIYSFLPDKSITSEGSSSRGWTSICLINLRKENQSMELEPRERNHEGFGWPGDDLPTPSLPYDPPPRDPNPDFDRTLPYDPPQRPEPTPQQEQKREQEHK